MRSWPELGRCVMKCSVIHELLSIYVCPIHYPSAARIRYEDADWLIVMLRCKPVVEYFWDKIRYSIRLWTIFQFLRSMFHKIHSSILVSYYRFPNHWLVAISVDMLYTPHHPRFSCLIIPGQRFLPYVLHSPFNPLLVAPYIPLVTLFPQIMQLYLIISCWVVKGKR
jgi:hypothetical protein